MAALNIDYFGLKVIEKDVKKIKKLLSYLTVKEIPAPGRPKHFGMKTYKCMIRQKDEFYIPTAAYDLAFSMGMVEKYEYLPPVVRKIRNLKMENKNFFSYQMAAINHVNELYKVKNYAYLEIGTGLGKTRIGCGLIGTLKEPTLIVCPTDAIANQWIEEYKKIFPMSKISMFKNSMKNLPTPADYDAIVVIINTLRAKPGSFYKGYGLIIFDEAHEYQSEKSRNIFWYSQNTRMLGLSASPNERKDGMDFIINKFLGNPIGKNDIEDFDTSDINFKVNVNIINYEGHDDHCGTVIGPTGTMSAILTIGNIITDPFRNKLIANEVYKYLTMKISKTEEKRHGIFVFAEHREYLSDIKTEIQNKFKNISIMVPELDDYEDYNEYEDYELTDDEEEPVEEDERIDLDNVNQNISVLKGGVSKNAVDDAKKEKAHVVLTTYGFSRRGISLPDMTCIILATPRRNGMNQVVGRILRRNSDHTITREIIDIVDVCTGLKPQIGERQKLYKARGYTINRVKVNWQDVE